MTSSASTWEQADKAYQLHHINCPQCIAAGAAPGKQERCPQGQALWETYQAAGDPPHFTWLPTPTQPRSSNSSSLPPKGAPFTSK